MPINPKQITGRDTLTIKLTRGLLSEGIMHGRPKPVVFAFEKSRNLKMSFQLKKCEIYLTADLSV